MEQNIIKMINMKVNLKMVKEKDMEYISIQIKVQDMKLSLKMIKQKDMEKIFIIIKYFFMGKIKMV